MIWSGLGNPVADFTRVSGLGYLSITEVKYFSAAECSPVYNSLHGCGEDEGDLHLAADPVFCLSSDVVEVGGGGLKNFAAPDGAALW